MTQDELVKLTGDFTTHLIANSGLGDPDFERPPDLQKVTMIMCAVMAGITGQAPESLDAIFAIAAAEMLKQVTTGEGVHGGPN